MNSRAKGWFGARWFRGLGKVPYIDRQVPEVQMKVFDGKKPGLAAWGWQISETYCATNSNRIFYIAPKGNKVEPKSKSTECPSNTCSVEKHHVSLRSCLKLGSKLDSKGQFCGQKHTFSIGFNSTLVFCKFTRVPKRWSSKRSFQR